MIKVLSLKGPAKKGIIQERWWDQNPTQCWGWWAHYCDKNQVGVMLILTGDAEASEHGGPMAESWHMSEKTVLSSKFM